MGLASASLWKKTMENECPVIWLPGDLALLLDIDTPPTHQESLLFEGREGSFLDKRQESNWRQRRLNQHHPGLSSSLFSGHSQKELRHLSLP